MISIEDMLLPQRILMNLPATDKAVTLRAMVDRLHAIEMIGDPDEAHFLLLEREKLMTTGVKRGFAFPHAFSRQFDSTFMTLGVVPGGVDYHSLNGHPVEFIFLLFGPPTHQTLHLRMLARISRLTAQVEMLELMRQAADARAMMELLLDSERRLKAYPYGAGDRL